MEERDYGLPDAAHLTWNSGFRLVYVAHESEFNMFDPGIFTAAFKDNWRNSLLASLAVDTDELRDDNQAVLTERVETLMAEGRRTYIDMKYWVEKAFPNSEGQRSKFGLDTYSEDNQSQARMLVLLNDMHKAATDAVLGPILLAAGYTPAKVTALGELVESLLNENAVQDSFIMMSPKATDARVKQYNETYGYARTVNRASKSLYYGNVTMLNLFTLPASGNTTDVFNVTGTVTDSTTGTPISGATVKVPALGITVTSDANGNYGLTELPAGVQAFEFSAIGYVMQSVSVTVPPTGAVVQDAALVTAP